MSFLRNLFARGATASSDQTYLPEKFVVFDLETTGLNCNKHRIIEVGAVRFFKGRAVQESFSSLIKTGVRLTPKITQITGITGEIIANEGRDPVEVFSLFREFIEELPLISYNYDFDGPFLSTALQDYIGLQQLRNPTACALKMARRAWPGLDSYRLEDIARRGKLDINQGHRALPDAQRALAIYISAAAKLKSWK